MKAIARDNGDDEAKTAQLDDMLEHVSRKSTPSGHSRSRLFQLSNFAVPLWVMFGCSVLLVIQSAQLDVSDSGFQFSLVGDGSMSASDFLYASFGVSLLFGGIALLVVAYVCKRMDIPGFRRLGWFAFCALTGGLWCLFDPRFIFVFLPFPATVLTVSALCEYGLAVTLAGYIRASAGPLAARVASAFVWFDAALLLAGSLAQLVSLISLFELTTVAVMAHVVWLMILAAAFIMDTKAEGKRVRDYDGLVVLIPSLLGLGLESVSYVFNLSLIGPWFETGFLITITAQITLVMRYFKRQSEQAARSHELEQALMQSKIAMLMSQIQPHFLYNALNVIQYLCETNPQLAAKTVNRFAQYLRGNMDSLTQTSPIPISRDLEHLQNYLAIEELRFPDIQIELSIRDTDFSVPPFTLQPLVENAIRHGFGNQEAGGTIRIETWVNKDAHYASVADTGVGFDPARLNEESYEDGRSHTGLRSTEDRLIWMCGGTLCVDSALGKGSTVTIRIPKTVCGIDAR